MLPHRAFDVVAEVGHPVGRPDKRRSFPRHGVCETNPIGGIVSTLVGTTDLFVPGVGIAPNNTIVVAAGDGIELAHQRLVIPAWFGLLFVPPAMTVVAIFVLPWLGIPLNVNQPARAMAQFFDESYQRRLGAPLPIVAVTPLPIIAVTPLPLKLI